MRSCVVALVRQRLQLRHWTSRHSSLVTGTMTICFWATGDALTMDTRALTTCHCIFSGLPCPPWSNIGLRGGEEDIWSGVFWTVCDHVIYDARFGVLIFFVLGNVTSLDYLRSGQASTETLAMQLEAYLQDGLGSGWMLEKPVMNTMDLGLPQRRKRLYITGRKMASYPLGCPSPCPTFKQPGHSW